MKIKKEIIIKFILLIIVTTSFIVVLSNKNFVIVTSNVSNDIKEIEGIDIQIKNNTLSNKGVTIIITDQNNNNYNTKYRIDKLINNKWYELKSKKNTCEEIVYTLDENNTLELKLDWKDKYGILSKGKYRIVKEVNNDFISVEFVI